MRLEHTLENTKIGKVEFIRSFKSQLGSLFEMNWELSDSESRLKMAGPQAIVNLVNNSISVLTLHFCFKSSAYFWISFSLLLIFLGFI